MAPIDNLFDQVGRILKLGDQQRLSDEEMLGRLLVLGLVTAVEEYVRSVLAGVIAICPRAEEAVAGSMIAMGSVKYYDRATLAHALFEHASFTSIKEINKFANPIIGSPVPAAGPFGALASEFEKLGTLRHAAVHTGGWLATHNARTLGFEDSKRRKVVVGFAEAQDAGKVTTEFARAFNEWAFGRTVQRWIDTATLSGSWKSDRSKFQRLFTLFQSSRDAGPSSIGALDHHRSLRPTIVKRLASS